MEGRFAERLVHGVDDAGATETIVIWIERKQGAIWAVGRAVNLENRATDEPRRNDEDTRAIAEYNERITTHPQLLTSIVPLRDGVAISIRTH